MIYVVHGLDASSVDALSILGICMISRL